MHNIVLISLVDPVSGCADMNRFRSLASIRGLWMRSRLWDSHRCCSSEKPVSTSYVEEMYYAWLEDHKNVHEVE